MDTNSKSSMRVRVGLRYTPGIEVIYLQNLSSMNLPQVNTTTVYEENTACIK